ncbi:MAG TPA: hypothetical protein VK753_05820 [Xanthomonadaceae bacterium]|jgi:hypothetical protein|nr:hypothetical protein [Xanthomonadaceae bacterium]
MNVLKLLFRRADKPLRRTDAEAPRLRPLELEWHDDTTMPIVDWNAAHAKARELHDENDLRDFWWSAAIGWLEALRAQLGDRFRIERSGSFAMLSALPDRQTELTLRTCERYRKSILRMLEGVATSWGHGPHVVLVFEDPDQYYEYISHYYPKEGTFAMSSGVFIQSGYGHFAFVSSKMDTMEPIIAHELTHCLLAPLRLPAWVNEGTAVSMERYLCPNYIDPRNAMFDRRENLRDRKEFWNAQTIQQFWSGKSFKRPDKGSSLSYDLATELTRLIGRDYLRYRAFMNACDRVDAGVAAATAHFNFSLGDLAGAVLGEGRWEPDPKAWNEGTEKGQF